MLHESDVRCGLSDLRPEPLVFEQINIIKDLRFMKTLPLHGAVRTKCNTGTGSDLSGITIIFFRINDDRIQRCLQRIKIFLLPGDLLCDSTDVIFRISNIRRPQFLQRPELTLGFLIRTVRKIVVAVVLILQMQMNGAAVRKYTVLIIPNKSSVHHAVVSFYVQRQKSVVCCRHEIFLDENTFIRFSDMITAFKNVYYLYLFTL